jgi:hypothetical protein
MSASRFRALAYIILAALILAASVLLPMRTLTVPPNDFLLIAWNHGQQLLQRGAVDLDYPYPLWTQVLLLPFVLGSPELGAQLWFVCSLLLLASSIILLMQFLNWPLRLPVVIFTSLFVAAFGPVFTTLWLGQLNFVPLLSLALVLPLLKSKSWWMAGSALGLGLMKPQLTILVSAAVLALAVWERRWQLFVGFGVVLLSFIALSAPFAVTPRQIFGGGIEEHLVLYLAHTSTLWGLSLNLLPDVLWLPALLSGLLILWLAYLWIDSIKAGCWVERLTYLVGVTTVVNLMILPYSWFYNQAVLIVPIMYAVDLLRRFEGLRRILWLLAIVLVVYFLPSAVDVALTRIYLSEVYQVIPVIGLLPLIVLLQWQVDQQSKLQRNGASA